MVHLPVDFTKTALAAQNDDRKAFDQLKLWASNPGYPYSKEANQAWTKILDEHAKPYTVGGFSFPWKEGTDSNKCDAWRRPAPFFLCPLCSSCLKGVVNCFTSRRQWPSLCRYDTEHNSVSPEPPECPKRPPASSDLPRSPGDTFSGVAQPKPARACHGLQFHVPHLCQCASRAPVLQPRPAFFSQALPCLVTKFSHYQIRPSAPNPRSSVPSAVKIFS